MTVTVRCMFCGEDIPVETRIDRAEGLTLTVSANPRKARRHVAGHLVLEQRREAAQISSVVTGAADPR